MIPDILEFLSIYDPIKFACAVEFERRASQHDESIQKLARRLLQLSENWYCSLKTTQDQEMWSKRMVNARNGLRAFTEQAYPGHGTRRRLR